MPRPHTRPAPSPPRPRGRRCGIGGAATRAWFVGLLATGVWLATGLSARTAHAHMGSTKVVQAVVDPQGATLDVAVQAVDAGIALGMGADLDTAKLRTHGALVQAWLRHGLRVTGEAGGCTSSARPPRLTDRNGTRNISVRLRYICPQPMGQLVLADATVFDDDPDHEVFVSIEHAGGTRAAVLRAEQRTVPLGRATEPDVPTTSDATATAAAFVVEGGVHLVTGYDHLLFVLSLVLGAGLIVQRQGLRPALADVAAVVTAFTVGHSLSLLASSLGWITLPSQWVEAAIAASIIVVAAMNVARPRARTSRPWLAGGFGLIHGFGFSSVLAAVGLPTTQRLVALISFNVGIELAQLAFVAAALLPLSLLARHKRYQLVVLQGGSLAIASFGAIWLVERVWG